MEKEIKEYWTIWINPYGDRYGVIGKFYNYDEVLLFIKEKENYYCPNALRLSHYRIETEVIPTYAVYKGKLRTT